jgi:hypothetical protein
MHDHARSATRALCSCPSPEQLGIRDLKPLCCDAAELPCSFRGGKRRAASHNRQAINAWAISGETA